jgi:disulfide oxidoreductase YuzD
MSPSRRVMASIEQLVKDKYPGQYRVKFVITFSLDAFDYSEVLQVIRDQNLSLPVLAMAGEVKLSGNFSLEQVETLLRKVSQV